VVILANNRRLDISLNTTGQQSVRRYPFNAKDALTLLRVKGMTPGNRSRRRLERSRKSRTAKSTVNGFQAAT
jgi:hypothetical protein